MMQTGLLDWQIRFKQLDNAGDPLAKLQNLVDWKLFRADLEPLRDKECKSSAGRKPFDIVLMFKVLILQSLYNLSDDQAEFQIRDRLSFMRFLGLSLGDAVPDAKTIWLFREQLQRKGCRHKKLTDREAQDNRTRSRIRSRVEHVFGVQAKRAGRLIVQVIGLLRVKTKIGLRNLAYNLDRYCGLVVA